jgi:hypothetical protein
VLAYNKELPTQMELLTVEQVADVVKPFLKTE